MVLELDVFSDVVCPFCFIGRRRLQQALAEEPEGEIEVRWRAFQLHPELPPEGAGHRELLVSKFGSGEAVDAAHERIAEMGREAGIAFDFASVERAPNTFLAHRAIALAAREGRADAAVEACFTGHFERGVDVGDAAQLVPLLVAEAGLDADVLWAALDAGEGAQEVEADLVLAQQAGIHAVPCFIAGRRVALSGAHEPPLLRKLFATAREQTA
jgi:predicted DsbA family dithiol-disulfide isomerase